MWHPAEQNNYFAVEHSTELGWKDEYFTNDKSCDVKQDGISEKTLYQKKSWKLLKQSVFIRTINNMKSVCLWLVSSKTMLP